MPVNEVIGIAYIPSRDPERNGLEWRTHQALAEWRGRGEWFRDVPEVRAFIAEHAKPWPE